MNVLCLLIGASVGRLAAQEAEDAYNQFIQRLAANQVAKL